jgi:hypothetical protein
MPKVIFVGGTSFSGSTAFHLMLANDPAGFACGETETLFFPQRDGHVRRLHDARPESLGVWQRAYESGADRIYAHLFESMPQTEFIVDSSKNAHWIRMQNELLLQQGIDVHNLLIWKTPLEFAQSRKKRDMLEGWQREWRNAHRVYFTLIDRWRAVPYRSLAGDPQTVLNAVCREVGIPCFEGKAEFWKKPSHHLGGNYSARMHLHEGDAADRFASRWISGDRMRNHQQVYYEPVDDDSLEEAVAAAVRDDPLFAEIEAALRRNDVAAAQGFKPPERRLKVSPLERTLRSVRERYRRMIGIRRYRPEIISILEQDRQERSTA